MRFTITYRKGKSSMRVESESRDGFDEIMDAARETWGCEGVVLRDGYDLLASGGPCVSEGDVVEVLPDPFGLRRWREIPPRHGSARNVPPCQGGWVQPPTQCSGRTRSRPFSGPWSAARAAAG